MDKTACFYIGTVSKKIGFRGKISVKMNFENPDDYLNIKFIYIDIDNQLIPYQVISINSKKNKFLELKLEGITDESMTKKLITKDVFVNENNIQKKNKFSNLKLINYTVFDTDKNIGSVVDLIHKKSQNLIIVENELKQEILIPLVPNFISKIDSKNKILKLILPKGLIDLNIKS